MTSAWMLFLMDVPFSLTWKEKAYLTGHGIPACIVQFIVLLVFIRNIMLHTTFISIIIWMQIPLCGAFSTIQNLCTSSSYLSGDFDHNRLSDLPDNLLTNHLSNQMFTAILMKHGIVFVCSSKFCFIVTLTVHCRGWMLTDSWKWVNSWSVCFIR